MIREVQRDNGRNQTASIWCFSVFYFSDNSEYRPNIHFFQILARKTNKQTNIVMVMKHNSFCPGVCSLELFECQVYISTCVNTSASNTVWSGSKLVEKTQMPKATSNLKNRSLQLAAKEEMITAGIWFRELLHRPCTPAESHVMNLHPFVCMTPHSWVSVDHGTIFILQIFLSSMTSRYLDS